MSIVDKQFPHFGPCVYCGAADGRHRVFEAIAGRARAGESAEALAFDYDVTVEAILDVLRRCENGDRHGSH